MSKSSGSENGCGSRVFAFPPSSAFFVSLLFVERGDQNPNNLAVNIGKILTSTSFFSVVTFSAPMITTSSSKG